EFSFSIPYVYEFIEFRIEFRNGIKRFSSIL
ncbi:unnamed protein product, partial [marine sediment metagenome]